MEARLELDSLEEEQTLFGTRDRHRRTIARRFGVELVSRNGELRIIGDEAGVAAAKDLLTRALAALRDGPVGAGNGDPVELLLEAEDRTAGKAAPAGPRGEEDRSTQLGAGVRPRSKGQERYVKAMAKTLTISVGPAGTGKTFLAVAAAVEALRAGAFRKLVLARPAVEAGERLGFLPGDLQAKVNPYLRPLYDSLYALLDHTQVRRYLETDVIEIVPLAYMRGRTLERAFIILDEAQNTTPKQMRMFLTRMGFGSKVVVTGDITQTDLPPGQASGLMHCLKILKGIDGIAIVQLGNDDIVRHPLVQKIVTAYEKHEDDGRTR
jgi:phosphate starvation-inducible PhoH-like protein